MPNPVGYVIAALQFGTQGSVPRTNRSFAGITDFVTFEEIHTDKLEITDHPIEQGGVISDHAFKQPAEVTMKIGWSNSGPGNAASGNLTSIFVGQDVRQVSAIYGELLDLQANREPFEVFTGKRYYRDMLIKEIQARTDPKTEEVLDVTITFRQVIRVDTVTVLVPASAQASPQSTAPTTNTGSRSLTPATTVNAPAAQQAINPGS